MTLESTTQLCRLLGDPTRLRLLSVLAQEPMTVAELVRVTEMGQSRVSTHLGRLREAGLLTTRRVGTATFYAACDSLPPAARMLRDETRDPLLVQDRRRAAEVVRARGGGTWADSVAGRMARHYSPGRTWESFARGAVGLARLGRVLDVASGDGALAELLSPQVRAVTCVDRSAKVVEGGRRRLAKLGNVHFLRAEMHDLPLADASHDAALLMSALCYAVEPERVLAEVGRVLSPGAPLVAVTLAAHRHTGAVAPYNHVQLGFEPRALRAMVRAAGFEVTLCGPTQREKRAPHLEVVTVHARRCR